MPSRHNYHYVIKGISIIAVILTAIMNSCADNESDNELSALDKMAISSMSTFERAGLDSIADRLLELAQRQKNKCYEAKAHFYKSSYSPGLNDGEKTAKLQHLETAEELARELDNDTLLCHIYNLRGVWELNSSLNFATAQYYFSRSIEISRKFDDRRFSIPAEINMAEVCRVTSDTLGLTYDLDLFEYARSKKEPLLLFTTGMHCAEYFAETAKDTTELQPYLDAMRCKPFGYESVVSMIFAKFYFHKGNYIKAKEYAQRLDTAEFSDYKVLYAQILNRLGRYQESDSMLGSLHLHPENLNYKDRGTLFGLRTANMAALGRWHDAYARQKEYESYRDSADMATTNDLVRRYRIAYESFAKDRFIKEQEAHILNMEILFAASAALAIVIAAGCFIYLRHRRRMYREIVHQNLVFMKQSKDLESRLSSREARLSELESAFNATEKQSDEIREYYRGGLSDQKADMIYSRIRELTDNEKVWRDTTLTRDIFADMVGCNRTYLAEVLREKTNMGYSQFMNSCRVKEAIAILSDPADDTPLGELYKRLGFLTIGTFYKVFKQHIGMSPAAFRKTARNL